MHKIIPPLTRQWIVERLADPISDGAKTLRGDHDLNPGTRSGKPLMPSAVLVGLIENPAGFSVLLTRRTDHLDHHPGQISFPGGRAEPHDTSPEDTALRETEEETGLHHRHIQIIGRLDTYETGTGFQITPIVALITPPFELSPDPYEVAEVFQVPLDFLLDPVNHRRHSKRFAGVEREYHAMPWGDYYIWGATAGMLINLYQAIVPICKKNEP